MTPAGRPHEHVAGESRRGVREEETTCGAPGDPEPLHAGRDLDPLDVRAATNFFSSSGAAELGEQHGPARGASRRFRPARRAPRGSAGRNGAPRTLCASASATCSPSPAASGRSSAAGSVSTCSTVTPPRWRKRRIALRDCGTAKAAPSATAATTSADGERPRPQASTAQLEPDTRSGVSGQSTRSASARARAQLIALPEPLERARDTRLDRAAANAERGRRLRLVEVEQVAAGEREARVVGQARRAPRAAVGALRRRALLPRGTGPRPPRRLPARSAAPARNGVPVERRRLRASFATMRRTRGGTARRCGTGRARARL